MDSIYDRALIEIGNENKYQTRYDVIYHIIFLVFWVGAYLNIILAITVTPHECKIPEKPHNISQLDWKIKNIPRYEDIKGKIQFDSCSMYVDPYKSNETKACLEYTYDTTWYDKTVPSEYNWVCDKELHVVSIMISMKIAEVIGSIFFGWFSDVYGRRYTYMISITMLLLGRMISLLAGNSYIIFCIGVIIAHLPSTTAAQTISVICLEMSSLKRGAAITRIRFIANSFGSFIMPLILWWTRDWKLFVILTTAPLIPFVIMSWKMIESPRWLYSQGRVQESIIILKKIAKTNNKNMEANTEKVMISLNEKAAEKPQVCGVFTLFSSRRLAFNTILQTIVWMVSSLSYAYLLMSSGEKTDSNPFLEFAWQSLIETPSVFISAWLADKIGRRYTGSGGLIREWWVGSLFNIVARLTTIVTFFVINLLSMEFYPTCLRQTGMAFGNIVGGAVATMVPYMIYLGRRYDPRIPGFILALTSFLGIIAAFILPETLNAKLPETLEEAQHFGSKDSSRDSEQLKPLKNHREWHDLDLEFGWDGKNRVWEKFMKKC
ncbi:unnamed protein product [Euphydryas editha]|uniref:Uncharacterized protein n=1 Tax=Euphydryas editha TaxID=104508 RepID=A0AAU9THW4_EUPED|nr:unnamed protein product [Euphydryas editha]